MNRLEKHFLGVESILSPNLRYVQEQNDDSLNSFASVPRADHVGEYFKVIDAFVGYQSDTSACVVMQAQKDAELKGKENEVYQIAVERVFQTCTKEAILRADLEQTFEIKHMNAKHLSELLDRQGRNSLLDFLWTQVYTKEKETWDHLLEVTSFCRIPAHHNLKEINRNLMEKEETVITDERHGVIDLNVLQTDQELVERIKDFERKGKDHNLKKVLFVTCAKANRIVSIMACAKYSIQNILQNLNDSNLLVLFLVQLPRQWYQSAYCSFSVGT